MLEVYLSFPIEYGDIEETRVRNKEIIAQLEARGISKETIFNPLDNDHKTLPHFGINSVEEFNELKTTDFPRYKKILQDFVDNDLEKVKHCRFVIAYIDQAARGGVVGEVTIARSLGIPVFAIVPDKMVVSGWTLACVDHICASVDELFIAIDNSDLIK